MIVFLKLLPYFRSYTLSTCPGLVEQLSLLRNINTRLTDENDLREYGNTNEDQFDETANLSKEMEEASTHFGSPNRLHISSELVEGDDDEIASMIVFDPLPQELQVQVIDEKEIHLKMNEFSRLKVD